MNADVPIRRRRMKHKNLGGNSDDFLKNEGLLAKVEAAASRHSLAYLKTDELRRGYLYRIKARNAHCGIWVPELMGFVISRFKFGSNYLFVEIHWDLDEWHGTVKPLGTLEKAPFNPAVYSTNDIWTINANPIVYYPILRYLNEAAERFGLNSERMRC